MLSLRLVDELRSKNTLVKIYAKKMKIKNKQKIETSQLRVDQASNRRSDPQLS